MKSKLYLLWQWRLFWAVLASICLVLIVYYGLLKTPSINEAGWLPWPDKILHILAFCGLAATTSRALPQWPWWRIYGVCFLVGFLLEILQWLNPPREASIGDLAADLFGIWLGVNVVILIAHGFSRVPKALLASDNKLVSDNKM